ncbi:hypothetical protein ACIBQ1_38250 [Nonomuraea sp. NPDC050153]|uniref:hypothetical protein n=1 Tax=Nonomuraea sp. NPDC050153 TaxID=3364359 RepID=UPI00379BE983
MEIAWPGDRVMVRRSPQLGPVSLVVGANMKTLRRGWSGFYVELDGLAGRVRSDV